MVINMDKRLYWLWLSLRELKPTAVMEILEHYDDAQAIYEAKDYTHLIRRGSEFEKRLLDKDLSEAEKILKYCDRNGVRILTMSDPCYPRRLLATATPPLVLYVRGIIKDFNSLFCLSIVGTRNFTPYGRGATAYLAAGLAMAGVCVVSGMARGIDSIAARNVLWRNGTTIAVLGSGIDVIYPPEHGNLMREIEKHGAVITEFPPGTPPNGRNFPIRNRIIAGFSAGVIVSNAPMGSGALITANIALDEDRDVFAVPSDIFDQSFAGCNHLIRQGAIPVSEPAQVLDEYRDCLESYHVDIRRAEQFVQYKENYLQLCQESEQDRIRMKRYGRKGRAISIEKPVKKAEKQEKESGAEKPKKPEKTEAEKPAEELTAPKSGKLELNDQYSPDEKRILSCLLEKDMHVDEIAEATGIELNVINAALLMLELEDAVEKLPSNMYRYKYDQA